MGCCGNIVRFQMFEGGGVPCSTIETTAYIFNGTLGLEYYGSIEADSGSNYTIEITSGSLPPGLIFTQVNDIKAEITGIPTEIGTKFEFDITITDSNGCSSTYAQAIGIDYISDVLAWKTDTSETDPTILYAYNALVVAFQPIRDGGKKFRVNMFAGTDFATVFYPIIYDYGTSTDTNNNFVSGDWSLTTGLQGNGSSKYVDTGVDPSSEASLTLDSAGMDIWFGSDPSNGQLNGYYAAGKAFYLNVTSGNTIDCGVNDNGFPTIGTTALTDMLVSVNRVDGTDLSTFVNGANKTTAARASNTEATGNLYMLACNNSGSPAFYTNAIVEGYIIRDGLSDSDMTTIYNALVTFNTAIGR